LIAVDDGVSVPLMQPSSYLVRLVFALSLVAGCGTPLPNHAVDGGSQTICPDHPGQCAGKCCGTQCLDTMSDPRNCGDCNQQCPMGTICFGGHCGCPPNGLACGGGQTCCGSLGCVSLDSDIRNCGGCGVTCGDGAVCSGGKCLCGGVMCPSGQTCCGGACAASCGSTAMPDMAMTAGGPPAGSCTCSDKCAMTFTKQCVNTDCCWENAFLFMTCKPSTTCAPWTYK
jgi:hypothetical protein